MSWWPCQSLPEGLVELSALVKGQQLCRVYLLPVRTWEFWQIQAVTSAFHAAELPGGIFTCCMKTFGAPVCWLEIDGVEVIAVEGMMRDLEHPRKGVVEKEPRGWAVQHLLLHSLMASGASSSTTSEHQKGYHDPRWWRVPWKELAHLWMWWMASCTLWTL